MDKKKAICEYLRKNHIGKGNAMEAERNGGAVNVSP